MRHPLRHLSTQPYLRMMAWLAWLMLALLPAHAMPVAMAGSMAPMASMSSAMPAQHAPDRASACCADHLSTTGCQCTAGGAFTVPPADAPALPRVRFTALSGSPDASRAPGLPAVPPLRPPSRQTAS